MTVKYDDVSWHCGGDFPEELEPKNGATHTGMFLKWCIIRNYISKEFEEDYFAEIEKIKRNEITGAELIVDFMDGKFSPTDLNETGNAFAKDYYVDETNFADRFSSFATDYLNLFDSIAEESDYEYETFYHIEDTYENYNLMQQIIDHRFEEWKEYIAQ